MSPGKGSSDKKKIEIIGFAAIPMETEETITSKENFSILNKWVLEEEENAIDNILHRVGETGVTQGLMALKKAYPDFKVIGDTAIDESYADVLDIRNDEFLTVGIRGDRVGGYRMRKVDDEVVPDDILQEFNDSIFDYIPGRQVEFYELADGEIEDFEYTLEQVLEDVSYANRAITDLEEVIEEGEYINKAFAQNKYLGRE